MTQPDHPQPKMDQSKQARAPQRSVSASFVDMITILMRTEGLRDLQLKDLEWALMPGVLTGQFALAHGEPAKSEGEPQGKPNTIPMAMVVWAMVSEEVDARLREDTTSPLVKLEPKEWRSGDIPWITVAAGTPDALRHVLTRLTDERFTDKPANLRVFVDGKIKVQELVRPPNE